MDHMENIRNFIIENFLFGDGEKLGNETSFLDSGIIDSTGILELVAFIEENFDINIDDTEMLPENFKEYTLQQVQLIPELLARAGFEIKRIKPS